MKLQADLYITSSLEGYIANNNGGTGWTLNQELRDQTARKYGCVCMGRDAFKKYKKTSGIHVIVLTRRIPKKITKGVSFVSSPQAAIVCAQKLGFKKLLVLGGAQTNQSFMQAGLIKKIYRDIHPVLLGRGLYMWGDFNARFDTTTLHRSWHDAGFTHAEYAVGAIHTTAVAVVVRDDKGSYLIRRTKDGICLGDTATLATTFSQRKAEWIDSQQLNQHVVDKKITPQSAQAYSFYKQWL